MLDALYDFFYSILGSGDFAVNYTDNISFQIGGFSIDLTTYLCVLLSLISLIIIVILCCLFVYKIIKLIGGLIR